MNTAKILHLDIETAPMLVWAWGLFKQNVSIGQIHQDWHMLCWAAKWHGKREVSKDALWFHQAEYRKDRTNDKTVLLSLWCWGEVLLGP